MSQILIDSLNNLNNTAINTLQSKKSDIVSAMDKSNDFSKAFEKTLSRPADENDINNAKISKDVNAEDIQTLEDTKGLADTKTLADAKTLGDIKTKNTDLISTQELATFKEILAKASNEANVETSLDLTLAKDMSELIAQFKDLLEKVKADFSTTEDSAESIEVATEENEVTDKLVIDLMNMLSDITKLNDAKDIKELDLSALYSQVCLVLNNKLQDFSANNTSLENLEQLKSMLEEISKEDTTLTFDTTNEILEFVDNAVSEVVSRPATDTQESEFDLQIDEDILKELNIEEIQADAGSADFNESFMQNQSAEEHAVKAMINGEVETFEIKIDKAINVQQAQVSQPKQVDVNPSKILSQIAKHLEGLQNNSKVNIVLNPEALGKVNVQLLNTKEGLMAQFTVATQEAKDILMKGLDGLKESLLSHGVSVDNVSVKMSETQKSSYNPDWTEQEGSRGGNKEQGSSNKEEKEKGLFEKMMAQVNQENGEV